MSDNNKGSRILETTLAFLLGTVTGAILGLLFAPTSGQEFRQRIGTSATKTGEKIKEGYEKIAQEAEKGIKTVKKKTQEGVEVIKGYVEKKKEKKEKETK